MSHPLADTPAASASCGVLETTETPQEHVAEGAQQLMWVGHFTVRSLEHAIFVGSLPSSEMSVQFSCGIVVPRLPLSASVPSSWSRVCRRVLWDAGLSAFYWYS